MRIIVHCSDSEWGHATIIEQWHKARWGELVPEGRPCIGYHAVIMNGFPTNDHWQKGKRVDLYDGMIEMGRPLDSDDQLEVHERGAHAYGFNRDTVAVCLIGVKSFTKAQICSLTKLLDLWRNQFNVSWHEILGHKDLPGVTKTCPNLEMGLIRAFTFEQWDRR